MHRVSPAQRGRAGLGEAEVAHLAGADEIGHGPDDLLDRHRRVHPVLVEQVDPIGPEPLQRGFDDLPDMLRAAVEAGDPALGIDPEAELGRQHDPVPPVAGQAAAQQLLVGIGPVDLGGVDQRDPPVHRLEQRGLAFRSVRAPAVGEGHAHAPETQGRDFEALMAESSLLHCPTLLKLALTQDRPPLRIRGSLSAEGYPSGQREQTVNLPAHAFVGSNPTPSTRSVDGRRGGSVDCGRGRQARRV